MGTNLNGANLVGANLKGADLTNADLRASHLCSTHLVGTNMHGANLKEATFSEDTSWPEGLDFTKVGAIGPGAELAYTKLAQNAEDFTGANLIGADLSAVIWRNLYMHDYCYLSRALLMGANLSSLSEVQRENIDLEEAFYDDETIWPDDFDFLSAGCLSKK